MKLSELIKHYRKENKLSQRQFAKYCGVSNTNISFLEKDYNPKTGERITPSLPMLKKIAEGMHITLDELLNQVEDFPISLKISTEITKESTEVNSKRQKLISLIDQMSPEQQQMMIDLIESILHKK